MPWAAAEPDVKTVLAAHPDPLAALARADVPAVVLRGAYRAERCAALIDRFAQRGLMDRRLLDPGGAQPRRVDIGTSLSNRAADKEAFLAHGSRGSIAQSILHRCRWTPELEPCLQQDRFADYARANAIERYRVDLEPGDLYFFNTGLVHEVPALEGSAPRVVLAVFIGYSEDDPEVFVWS